MSDVLHFAYVYWDRGWPIIPTVGKTPAVRWSAYQRKRPTLEQLREWFAGDNDYNLAIVTGRTAGLVVVDCDSAEDASWWQRSFPETPLAVRTGGGGLHLYYRYPESEVRSQQRVLGRRIDVRAEGGLVVAPPSIHPDTGEPYRWRPWEYWLSEVPVFDRGWIRTATPLSQSTRQVMSPAVRHGLAYIRRIEAVSGSGGHNATFRAACKLRDTGLTADEALDALADWNETNATPPWTAKELAHKVSDAYRKGTSR